MQFRLSLWLLLPLFITAAPVKTTPTATTATPVAETNSIGVKLILIEPGSFRMGQDGPAADYNVKVHAAKFDDADGDEKPAHPVTLTAGFKIGATELTLSQYRRFQPEHGANKGADQDAVTNVSWHDAVNFCAWLSKKEGRTYRLPTEAEWEYACRAGTTSLFHTGDALTSGFHKWPTDTGLRDRFFPNGKLPEEYRPLNAKGDALRVGQTPANPWGLVDMHGNVSEWCADWYGPYEPDAQSNPLGRSSGDFRVTRGGSHSMQTRLLRSANRTAWLPHTQSEKTGFRIVCGEWPKGTLLPPAPPALNAQDVSQTAPHIETPPPSVPFFAGPIPFVIIPPKSSGPLFSWHNHSPAITECPNGDLLAVWYSCVDEAGTELNNLASRLRFGRHTWEPASVFWDGADINDHAPKLWWDGERTLFHFARGQVENIMRTSTDNGATWSQAITTQPVGEWGNAPIRTRDGRLLITCDVTTTSLNVSRDGGRTWTFTPIGDKKLMRRDGSSARHAGIHAPIVELNDGRLMTLGRLNTEEEQAKFNFKTPASYSSDGGLTWTHEATPFPAISSVQRQVFMRLREGPLLFCSFTDLSANSKKPKGMDFPREGGTLHGAGLFAALSFDEGKTWPNRRLITPGGSQRTVNGIDRGQFTLSDTSAEPQGYLAATQTRDGRIHLISSKNHYIMNLSWLQALPRF
jgi:sulfatase modifying factor 1